MKRTPDTHRMTRRPFRLFSILLLFLSFTAAISCRVQVTYDDGDPETEQEPPIKDLSQIKNEGFQNKTIVSLGDTGVGWSGVDILLVMDNSDAMAEEQISFASEIYTLITSLTNPVNGAVPVKNIRLATTTADLGLQWGAEGFFDPTPVDGCNGLGDNGYFQDVDVSITSVPLKSGRIPCDEVAAQCPQGWTCNDGRCTSSPQNNTVLCDFYTGNEWIETSTADPDPRFAEKAACLAVRGSNGCTVEQQLESMRRALRRNPDFTDPNHLLIVLIVSDEEDCSIADSALFLTEEWTTPETRQIACNYPTEHNSMLFAPAIYRNDLVTIKNENPAAVIFAAIVGAPVQGPCNGNGDFISTSGCMADQDTDMSLTVEQNQYQYLFRPACSRRENTIYVTAATPGRRFVETARLFGINGYVESICDETYGPLIEHVTDRVDMAMETGQCLLSDGLEVEAVSGTCTECVQSKCEMYLEILRTGEAAADKTCPHSLVFGNNYHDKAAYQEHKEGDTVVATRVFCPVQKMPVPIDCAAARESLDYTRAGWAYCENRLDAENTEYTCSDGVDNDADGITDCDAETCGSCKMCGSLDSDCGLGCKYDIILTQPANEAAEGNNLFLECPFR